MSPASFQIHPGDVGEQHGDTRLVTREGAVAREEADR
jgi:hypothetical protein